MLLTPDLTTEVRVIVHNGDGRALFCSATGRGHSRWTGTNDENFTVVLDFSHQSEHSFLDGKQFGSCGSEARHQ
jgi:hypothetical protein